MQETKSIIRYVLSRGGISTFRLSRIMLLLDLKWGSETGRKATGLHYVLYPSAFYIEEFPDILENDEHIEKIIPSGGKNKKGIFRLKSGANVELAEDLRSYIDDILKEVNGMDDHTLNMAVVSREDYKKLLS